MSALVSLRIKLFYNENIIRITYTRTIQSKNSILSVDTTVDNVDNFIFPILMS